MERSRSRAQLILIAGVGIAVTFIALALILNTVIYTETLSTRQGVDGQDAIVFERAAEDGVGGLVSQLNYFDYDSYDSLHADLRNSTATWDNMSAWSQASRGTAVSTELVDVENGTHIVQEGPSRTFTNTNGTKNWTVVDGAGGVRRFRMDVDQSSLNTSGNTPFEVLTDSDTVTIQRTGTGNVTVDVFTEGQCNRSPVDGRVSIDLSGGTVNGTECDPLKTVDWANTSSITYRYGDSVRGRYTLIADVAYDPSTFENPPYSGTVGTDPYAVRAIYSATLNVSVESDRLDYVSTVTAAPERPVGGETYDVYTERRELVYDSSSANLLSSIHPNGTITRYDAPGVQAIGPKEIDFDGDDLKEIPYVNSSGTLKTIDANNETQVLASNASTSKTLLGVGQWRGNTSVYYVNTSDNGHIYRVNWTTGAPDAPSEVLVDANGVKASAVAGPGDFNGDGDADLVYTGTSQGVYYVDGDNTVSVGRGVGQNNGIGIGAPRQHDGAGLIRVPMVDGSGNIALLNYNNQKTSLTSSGQSAKSPVAGLNWKGGSTKEVVFVDSGTDVLYYVTLDGSIEVVKNGNVMADPDVGVA